MIQKYGIDIHGVITKKPVFYAGFTKGLIDQGHEVHIITGVKFTPKLHYKLKEYGILYDHFFSITDFHRIMGTEITYTDPDNPHMDVDVWNRTKADYCKRHNIDLHIDDSDVYGKYFEDIDTVYVKVNY